MSEWWIELWKEALIAKLKTLYRHLSGGTEEKRENLSQDPGPSEYEAGVLPLV